MTSKYIKNFSMKKPYYILILFFLSTVYLFSQTEESKTIEVDTVVKIDTVVVIKVDTVTMARRDTIVLIEPTSRQKRNGLDNIEKTTSIIDTYNKAVVQNCKKTGILSVRIGVEPTDVYYAALDIPISCYINVSSIYTSVYGNKVFGVGLGAVGKNSQYFIIKSRICPILLSIYDYKPDYSGFEWTNNFGVNMGIDMLLKYKFIGISLGIDCFINYNRREFLPYLLFYLVG